MLESVATRTGAHANYWMSLDSIDCMLYSIFSDLPLFLLNSL